MPRFGIVRLNLHFHLVGGLLRSTDPFVEVDNLQPAMSALKLTTDSSRHRAMSEMYQTATWRASQRFAELVA
jgi:hypothetical protein